MRVLFTTIPGLGHLHPLVPLARTLRERGHDVAFATAPRFCEAVEWSGFRALAAGPDWLGSETTPGADPLASLRKFVDAGGEMADDLLALTREYGPDVLVREQAELGGWIAAARGGIPSIVQGINVPWSHDFLGAARAEFDRQRDRHALPPDPELRDLFGDMFLDIVPPSFRPPGVAPPPGAHPVRPVVFDRSGPEGPPEWIAGRGGRPIVYATLGTVFNRATHVFQAILEALREEPVNLLLTVGRNVEPDSLGAQPDNVRIERYVPQSLVLPHCSAVVTHGGFNTTMASLSHGLPVGCVPLGGDQAVNAARCAQLGVGVTCAPPDGLDPDVLRAAVRRVLDEAAFADRARRLRTEIEAMPGPEVAADLVERVAG